VAVFGAGEHLLLQKSADATSRQSTGIPLASRIPQH
jgi:hypothetical protein